MEITSSSSFIFTVKEILTTFSHAPAFHFSIYLAIHSSVGMGDRCMHDITANSVLLGRIRDTISLTLHGPGVDEVLTGFNAGMGQQNHSGGGCECQAS